MLLHVEPLAGGEQTLVVQYGPFAGGVIVILSLQLAPLLQERSIVSGPDATLMVISALFEPLGKSG